MADPLTHALLGAACYPEHPIVGAAIGLAPDAILIPMNAYTFIKYRETCTEGNWPLSQDWMRSVYRNMHGLLIPAGLAFWCWFLVPALFPMMMAYLSHVLIDIPLHSRPSYLWPLRQNLLDVGWRDWWSDWKIPVITISASLLIVLIQHEII